MKGGIIISISIYILQMKKLQGPGPWLHAGGEGQNPDACVLLQSLTPNSLSMAAWVVALGKTTQHSFLILIHNSHQRTPLPSLDS